MKYRHIEGTLVKAVFSGDGKFRYRLEVRRAEGKGTGSTVCVVMQNPSYAGEEIADRSVQFMEKIIFTGNLAEFSGVERMIVVNLYAYIQTKGFAPDRSKIGPENDGAIERAIAESDIIVMAWGSSRSLAGRQSFVMELLKRYPGKVLLRTRSHPSRGRSDGFIEPYHL